MAWHIETYDPTVRSPREYQKLSKLYYKTVIIISFLLNIIKLDVSELNKYHSLHLKTIKCPLKILLCQRTSLDWPTDSSSPSRNSRTYVYKIWSVASFYDVKIHSKRIFQSSTLKRIKICKKRKKTLFFGWFRKGFLKLNL